MKETSYKHRVVQVLSVSAAVLLAALVQGRVLAEETPQDQVLQAGSNLTQAVKSEATSSDKETLEVESPQAPQAEDGAALQSGQARSAEESTQDAITLKQDALYLSESNQFEDTLKGQAAAEGKISWTLDKKPLADWKVWEMGTGDLTGQPFMKVTESKEGEDLRVSIETEALFGEDLSLRDPSNIRRTYRNFIGKHELEGKIDGSDSIIRKVLTFRPYESFMTHDEMLAAIEESRKNAKKDRLVTIENFGTSAQGRDLKVGIVSKDQASIDSYLKDINPLTLTKPQEALKLLKEGKLNYKLPVLINNTHADEQPAIDIIRELFDTFSTKEQVTFASSNADGQEEKITLKVQDLLEKFIFLFDFTENPDGDVANTRSLANGMDPNRDASYQTNPETKAVVALINKWNPIALYDIHGFVEEFLIEPATPPHDPNFEYDLLSKPMMDNARAMGRAGIANSKYTSYIIPKVDWGEGWDDSFSGYTGVYAMYHGILGHTIEIPQGNQESFKAGFYAVLGGIHYLASQPDQLMDMRLQFYDRGINKVEDPRAEKELVGPDGQVVGRIKNGQDKFFPDYYVIPMGLDKDNDAQEAFNMIAYFKRNGVDVLELKEDVGTYKKGDLVIDMAQAKRGYANHILYRGSDESKWGDMYAELVVNFPEMKGFKASPVFADQLFAGKLVEVNRSEATRTKDINLAAPYYVIANNSESAIRAVNAALKQGMKVYLTEDGYIVDTPNFVNLLKDYALFGSPLFKAPKGPAMTSKKIYAPVNHPDWAGVDLPVDSSLVLSALGFQLVDKAEDADVILLEASDYDPDLVGKKPTLIIGGDAMRRLEKHKILDGFDAERTRGSHEGLLKSLIDDLSPFASGYKKEDLFYSNSGSWIEKLPAGFKTLMTIAEKDYYLAGWWPGNEVLSNKVVAAEGSFRGNPLFIYAGNPTNKQHPVHFFRWVTNAIFGDQLVELVDLPAPVEVDGEDKGSKVLALKASPSWQESASPLSTYGSEKRVLPQTGSQDSKASFALAGLFISLAGYVLYYKKKEN